MSIYYALPLSIAIVLVLSAALLLLLHAGEKIVESVGLIPLLIMCSVASQLPVITISLMHIDSLTAIL